MPVLAKPCCCDSLEASAQEDWEEVLTQCRQALEINPRAA